jgi:predicted transposase YbfD/YdcC
MVSAHATTNRLVLGQCKVDEKSNEITAIPELIKVLDIAGCIVTIDAMGCQKQIVKSIVDKSGEYVIALKKNQGNLYKNVEEIFKEAISKGFEGFEYSDYYTKEDEHGREEIRHYLMLSDIQERIDPGKKWMNLQSVGMVEYIRKVNGKTKVETRYYIVMIFTDVVEAIKGFSIEEKLQIQLLLQQYLREERREEIYQNLQSAKREEENGELTFSANIDELKQLMEE